MDDELAARLQKRLAATFNSSFATSSNVTDWSGLSLGVAHGVDSPTEKSSVRRSG